MLLSDRVGDGEAEARAFADGLRREERIEHLALKIFRHARPIVADLEQHSVAIRVLPGPQCQRSPAVRREHRLLGVDDEVQQDLLDLMWIGKHRRQTCRQSVHDADVGNALFVGAKRQRFLHDLIQIDRRPRRMPLPRERLQVADDTSSTFSGVVNRIEVAPCAFVEIARSEPFRACEDGCQDCSARAATPTSLAERRQLSA